MRQISSLAFLRCHLILRQRLGWASLLVGLGLVFLGAVTANVSYLQPVRIFWDFALGASFVLQCALALFLSTQLFGDEKQRRTLHLLLSAGLSRWDWLLGNALGIWLALIGIDLLWFAFSCGVAWLNFGAHSILVQSQVKLFQALELLVLIPLGLFASLWVRPLLALTLSISLATLLHALDSLQRVFTDPEAGRWVQAQLVSVVLWATRLLPPLHWFDVKGLVGYEPLVPWSLLGAALLVALAWSGLLSVAAWLRFERMDL
jgi:ABC-type transport system involved in multi-copper enzyme maturation permease subunit